MLAAASSMSLLSGDVWAEVWFGCCSSAWVFSTVYGFTLIVPWEECWEGDEFSNSDRSCGASSSLLRVLLPLEAGESI